MGKINKTTQEINALLGVAGGHGADIERLDRRIAGVVELVGDCADAQDTDTRLKALEGALPECMTELDVDYCLQEFWETNGKPIKESVNGLLADLETFDTSLTTLQGKVDECVTTENFNTFENTVDNAITQRQPLIEDSEAITAQVHAASQGKLRTRLHLTEQALNKVFDDLWRSAVGSYGTIDYEHVDEKGRVTPYMCNEVWMTYEEARACYKSYRNDWDQKEAYATDNRLARTNIPYYTQWSGNYDRFAEFNTSLEVAVIPHIQVGSLNYAFLGCVHLESVTIKSAAIITGVDGTFANCTSLKNLKFKGLDRSLSLSSSPLITKESLTYLCNNRAGTNAITITLHPTTYAKLTEGSGEDAAVTVPWTDLLDLAASKNISFASA